MPTHKNVAEKVQKSAEELVMQKLDLINQLSELQNSINQREEQKTQLADLTSELADLTLKKKEALAELDRLSLDISQKKLGGGTEVQNLNDQVDSLKKELLQLTLNLKMTKTAQLNVETQKSMIESEQLVIQNLLAVKKEQLAKVETDLISLQNQFQDLVALKTSVEKELQNLKLSVEDQMGRLAGLGTNKQSVQQEIASYKEELDAVLSLLAKSRVEHAQEEGQRESEKKDYLVWKALEKVKMDEAQAIVDKSNADLSVKEAWIDKKIDTVRRYKKKLEVATGIPLDNLTF